MVEVPIGNVVMVGDATGVKINFPIPLVTIYLVDDTPVIALVVRLNAPKVNLPIAKLSVPVTTKEPVRLMLWSVI